MSLSPYLHFNGNCEEAFRFYERTLGGKIECLMPHEGTPAASQTPPEWGKKILHACLSLKSGQSLLASDCPPNYYRQPQGFSVSLSVNEPDEADRIFHALSEDGKVRMPIQETFWARRFGMVTDRFGIPWMINCAKPIDAPAKDGEPAYASVE